MGPSATKPPARSATAASVAEVVFNLPLDRAFHYLVPPELSAVQPGMRVIGPFGPRERVGFVVKRLASSARKELKPIRRVIDQAPVVSGERWALAAWLSSYYCCSLGEALAAMVPGQLRLPAVQAPGPAPAEGAPSPLRLTAAQERAMQAIEAALEAGEPRTLLLHGVTGSGKTELYLRGIGHALRQGRSAIYLIPEIALTPQTIERVRARFGGLVAVWHSRLTAKQRGAAWADLASGRCRIVVGARSAIFSPLTRVGLIILDEEHETTYKQDDAPHLHARDVAFARARLAGAVVILGSATPSVESYYAATQPGGQLLELPERIQGRALPKVEIIDMREEMARRRRGGPLSHRLELALSQTVERKEQAMLLLNRRGFARVAQCQTCGETVRCRHCSVPLIYHAARKRLVCHYCNFDAEPPEICAACGKGYLRFRGSGTERIESELHRLFPASAIGRMDRDTTAKRESHDRLYASVKAQELSLLVGTQMIAKGLDFPQVTLVGIVSADTALNLPDFRAGERTFDLLTQMAGRAGRGDQPGRVLIQTYCPSHYAIQAAKDHDYRRFYEEELLMRRRLALPPFTHLAELMLRGTVREKVYAAADALAGALGRRAKPRGITLLGPAPHRIPRLRGQHRVVVLLKGDTAEAIVGLIREVLEPGHRFGGMPVTVNVDPQ